MKKILLIFLSALMGILILSGCSRTEKTDVVLKSQDVENADNSWDMIEDYGALKIGVVEGSLPYIERDSRGKYTGFLVDLTESLANQLNVDTEYVLIADESVVTLLANNSIDVILNGYTQADLGDKSIKWLDGYMTNHHIIVSYNWSNINSKDDLSGKKIGVAENTISDVFAQSDIKIDNNSIIKYETEKAAINALNSGQTDALIIEDAYLYYHQKYNVNRYNILDEIVSTHIHSLGVNANDTQTAEHLNLALTEIKNNGTLEKLHKKWFNTDLQK